jgi:hypothetical protein
MPKCLDVLQWKKSTPAEIREFVAQKDRGGHALVIRKHLRPVDVYSYLVDRLGEPNGVQTFLAKDDSDNLFHWDFHLEAQGADVYLSGMSREIHIIVFEPLSDEQWKTLIQAIKTDYRRVGRDKSAVMNKLEKFVLFQNKYVSIANFCADLHSAVLDNPGRAPVPRSAEGKEELEKQRSEISAAKDAACAPGAHQAVEHGPGQRDVEGALVTTLGRGDVEDAAGDREVSPLAFGQCIGPGAGKQAKEVELEPHRILDGGELASPCGKAGQPHAGVAALLGIPFDQHRHVDVGQRTLNLEFGVVVNRAQGSIAPLAR